MEIVKAEILWTRVCPNKCPYCAMATGKKNSVSLLDWYTGIDNLKNLGCGFIAFYGAEPLADYTLLPDVVRYAEDQGIKTTVITSGMVSKIDYKISNLYNFGLRSLSMSYDITPISDDSWKKSQLALPLLYDFKHYYRNVRDAAAIVTLTSLNYTLLPDTIVQLTREGIWTFFDFIHWDRGNPGTKCRNYPGLDRLKFTEEDIPNLLQVLEKVQELKEKGYLAHTSKSFIQMISLNPAILRYYGWNCACQDSFPSWVTIDCDGTVFPCDDFQPRSEVPLIPVTELYERWDEFKTKWKNIVRNGCSGCLWNTHIDAHFIKQGIIPFSDYVHTGKEK